MEPLRIGVLGAARISANAIVAPARELGARLVAVAARDQSRAAAFARQHGVERVLPSYADVIADPEVEVVYNPLANGLHGPWNLAAIAAGKHVLSEKPFASNAAEAATVRDAARAAGVVVGEAFHYRYHPLIERLQDLVASGELGALSHVEGRMVIPPPPPGDPRWSLPLAGGALMDLGCYPLHLARSLAPWAGGEPELESATGASRAGVDEEVDARLRFPSGATARSYCHMAAESVEMSARVVGSRGEAYLPKFVSPQEDDRLVVTTPDGERTERLGARPTYTYQLEAFTRAVREGARLLTDADDAVVTMRLIDRCYEAIGLGPRPSVDVGNPSSTWGTGRP
jgi:predicted dehydrogenase